MLEYLGETHAITGVCIKGRQEVGEEGDLSQKQEGCSDLRRGSEAKGYKWPPEAGKGQEFPEGASPANALT